MTYDTDMRSNRYSRRTVAKLAGTTTVAALLAGCPDNNNDDVDDEPDDDPNDDEPDVDAEDPEELADEEEWQDVDEFYFEGRIEAWTGVEPEFIEGLDNPTLLLFEDQEYDFTWINEDGANHNIAMWDQEEDGDVVDDFATEIMGDEGEEQTLESVEPTDEMTHYVCEVHPTTQIGPLEVRSE